MIFAYLPSIVGVLLLVIVSGVEVTAFPTFAGNQDIQPLINRISTTSEDPEYGDFDDVSKEPEASGYDPTKSPPQNFNSFVPRKDVLTFSRSSSRQMQYTYTVSLHTSFWTIILVSAAAGSCFAFSFLLLFGFAGFIIMKMSRRTVLFPSTSTVCMGPRMEVDFVGRVFALLVGVALSAFCITLLVVVFFLRSSHSQN